jgi:hypothetical protein
VPDGLGLAWNGNATQYGKRVGYVKSMFDAETNAERRADNERALAILSQLGCTLHDVTLGDGDLSYFIEYIERAAAFDTFTRAGQHPDISPRTDRFLRAGQLVTAVDYLQANRRRAAIMQDVARALATVDVVLFTRLTLDSRTSINPVLSLTGHPAIAVPLGFLQSGSPSGVMFSGQLYRDGDLQAARRHRSTSRIGERPRVGQEVPHVVHVRCRTGVDRRAVGVAVLQILKERQQASRHRRVAIRFRALHGRVRHAGQIRPRDQVHVVADRREVAVGQHDDREVIVRVAGDEGVKPGPQAARVIDAAMAKPRLLHPPVAVVQRTA